MPVLELLAILVEQLKQTPFYSKMASHTFSMLSRVTLTNGHQCYVSVPNNERVHFSHEVFVVGINVNAWLKMQYFDLIINKTIFIRVLYICWYLTAFHFLFAVESPSDLKFKILNENTVEMSWARPSSRIEGFRIQVTSDAGQYEVSTFIEWLNLPVYTHITPQQLIYC